MYVSYNAGIFFVDGGQGSSIVVFSIEKTED
jgi:hypothetical protein